MELKNPILDIDMNEENRAKLQPLKDGFEELNPEERFDVVELQNIMLKKFPSTVRSMECQRPGRKLKGMQMR